MKMHKMIKNQIIKICGNIEIKKYMLLDLYNDAFDVIIDYIDNNQIYLQDYDFAKSLLNILKNNDLEGFKEIFITIKDEYYKYLCLEILDYYNIGYLEQNEEECFADIKLLNLYDELDNVDYEMIMNKLIIAMDNIDIEKLWDNRVKCSNDENIQILDWAYMMESEESIQVNHQELLFLTIENNYDILARKLAIRKKIYEETNKISSRKRIYYGNY